MNQRKDSRYTKNISPSLKGWKKSIHNYHSLVEKNSLVQCGWGRVLFANTYTKSEEIVEDLRKENPEQRDIAFYVSDPHVLTSISSNEVFIDPSHTYRMWFENYRPKRVPAKDIFVRRIQGEDDIIAANAILKARNMVPLDIELSLKHSKSRKVIHLVAESVHSGEIVGFVTGVDHKMAFHDPENGCSLWSLAVAPNCKINAVGSNLVRYLIEFFHTRGNSYLDLSVMHNNKEAISMYEKLNFLRVPVYCVKRKNPINEALFTPKQFQNKLNPYGQIIVNEAARRGIQIEIIDKASNTFSLSYGARVIKCFESLSDQTSAVALSQCADKRLCSRLLKRAGIKVPRQIDLSQKAEKVNQFIEQHKLLVLKPAMGEQGQGVKVGLSTKKEIYAYVKDYEKYFKDLILEEMVEGQEVRVIVIDGQFVAASKRLPPSVVGDGKTNIEKLIQKLSRRRFAATGGESKIPIDDETLRVLKSNKMNLSTVPKLGEEVLVRKTSNLHTGGIMLDISDSFPNFFKEVAIKAAKVLDIPVVGFDFMIPNLQQKKYWIIEANERPGLANHEPQPTAERFIDFLFPVTRKGNLHEKH